MHRILLIDDDEDLAGPLATYLRRFDLALDSAARPGEGLERLAAQAYDAVILDVMLPEMDGFELCRRIRRDSDIPVLMLTARGELTDRVVGLELGADDYLPKPFEPRELAARLQTILRRAGRRGATPPAAAATTPPPQPAAAGGGLLGQETAGARTQAASFLAFDGLRIDLRRREVRCHDQPVALTSTEYELLVLLAREPGRVFSRDDILNHLRGHEADVYTRAVDILVSRLRRKLQPLLVIKTLRNAGYVFAAAPS